MKKFLIFLIICGVAIYFLMNYDTESGPEPEAEYNAKTYNPADTINPWDEEAYNLYRWDGEDD